MECHDLVGVCVARDESITERDSLVLVEAQDRGIQTLSIGYNVTSAVSSACLRRVFHSRFLLPRCPGNIGAYCLESIRTRNPVFGTASVTPVHELLCSSIKYIQMCYV